MSRTQAAICAVALGVFFGIVVWDQFAFRPETDFGQFWAAARALLAGTDPYTAVGPGAAYEWDWPLVYPLTAVVAALPLAFLDHRAAVSLFIGFSAGALGYAVARDGFRRLPLFLSAGFIWTAVVGQWSIALTAAATLPPLGFLFAAKPTLGAALFVYRPSRAAAIGSALLVAVSLLLWPSWPATWLRIAGAHSSRMQIPLLLPGGFLLLLAALRWKRPEARLLLALSLTPQTLLPYEMIVIFLLATRFWEAALLTVLSWVLVIVRANTMPLDVPFYSELDYYGRLTLLLMYFPALAFLLLKPNEGDTPELLARIRRGPRAVWRTWNPGAR